VAPILEFAVVGDPVDHSLSPAIHNAAFAALGLDARYRALTADEDKFSEIVELLRTGRLAGINVTMPLKMQAARLSDLLTPEAALSGSVNTMRLTGTAVEGHSTDTVSCARLLDQMSLSDTTPVLVLGSGGAAAGALAAADGRPRYLSARNDGRAAQLSGLFEQVAVIGWRSAVAGAVVVNATPLGMHGESLPPGVVELATGLIDLPYGPGVTPAAAISRRRGIATVDGYEFLVEQAADAFKWWTGREAPVDVMMGVVRKT
jgi:shikimate dehydrogenase